MNKKSPAPALKPQANKKINKRLVIFLAVGCVIVIGITAFLVNYSRNYAAEIAAPIEKELIKAGAVKKCSSGSTGREFGGSNLEPWYEARYSTHLKAEDAVQLLEKVFKNQGLNLKYERSPDQSIDLYIDQSRRQSNFSELISGEVKAGASIFKGDENNFSCYKGGYIEHDKDNVAINIDLSLPAVRYRLW